MCHPRLLWTFHVWRVWNPLKLNQISQWKRNNLIKFQGETTTLNWMLTIYFRKHGRDVSFLFNGQKKSSECWPWSISTADCIAVAFQKDCINEKSPSKPIRRTKVVILSSAKVKTHIVALQFSKNKTDFNRLDDSISILTRVLSARLIDTRVVWQSHSEVTCRWWSLCAGTFWNASTSCCIHNIGRVKHNDHMHD